MNKVHEVVFRQSHNKLTVGCICRVDRGVTEYVKDFSRSISPIAVSANIDEARELYNNPDNHYAPFTEEDRAKW